MTNGAILSHPDGTERDSVCEVVSAADADLSGLYRETRERLSRLVLGLSETELAAGVPACPGWSVSDVMYHLLAVCEDVMAGRLTKPPSEDETAIQVARHRGTPVREVVDSWAELAPAFEKLVGSAGVWPAVLDVATHEQDIRASVGRPGARDSEVVRAGAEVLVGLMEPSIPLKVVYEDSEQRVGPQFSTRSELVVRSNRFETFRWRLGRRSRSQLRALDWSGSPEPVIEQLCIFGPAREDILE